MSILRKTRIGICNQRKSTEDSTKSKRHRCLRIVRDGEIKKLTNIGQLYKNRKFPSSVLSLFEYWVYGL